MEGCCKDIEIKGIMSVVPENRVSNLDYIEKIENRRIKKQVVLTGIENRRVCIQGQTASDLATIAGERLLQKLQWNRDEIDVLIFVTQSPDLSRPSTAFIIQKRLNIGKDCLVFDINLGCSGYVGGLETIASILSVTKGKGLLLVGESHAMEGGDINTSSLLVGDGGSATALQYEKGNSMLFKHYSDGNRANYIYRPFNKPGYMDGNAVLLFGLNDVVDSLCQFKKCNKLREDDIDYYIFHQAQKMIVDGLTRGAELPDEKVLYSCRDYGNTSSASIPITMCANIDNMKTRSRKKVLMCGFGIGLSWGIVYTEIDTNITYSIEESNYVYQDKEMFDL